MPREFTCSDCGREIVSFVPREVEPRDLCAHCSMFPGWRDDPSLRLIFNPGEEPRTAAERREEPAR